MQQPVFTIGHSTHPQDRFIGLLAQFGITALCDVRSKPYSRVNPQFNRETLKSALKTYGIEYVFLGTELGARSEDPSCYEDGKVKYDRLANTELFRQGLKRILQGTKKYRIALMCAEKEPLECHRTILVARHLAAQAIEVQHILATAKLESHADALRRLSRLVGLPEEDMFRTAEELQADAYRLHENRIAYDSKPAAIPAVGTAAR